MNTILTSLDNFLNNASVSAFLGAVFAFFLVWLTDRRREHKKVSLIRSEVEHNLFHAEKKLKTARNSFIELRDKNIIAPGRPMRFNSQVLQRLMGEAIDNLSPEQRRTLDALCYTMTESDRRLLNIYQLAISCAGSLGHTDRVATAAALVDAHKESIIALKRLIQMCNWYVAGQYQNILMHQYNRADYIEWDE